MHILNTLLPIFLIVMLGSILRQTGFVNENFFKQSNRLIYWIGLPCLLFIKTAQITIRSDAALRITAILSIGMVACILVAYLIGWIMRIPLTSLGSFVQASFRGNLFYVGLPVVMFALSHRLTPDVEALAVLVIAPMSILFNIISVLVLLVGNPHTRDGNSKIMMTLMVKIMTNPLLLAVILGIVYSFSGLKVPSFLERALSTIGQMSLPLALLGIGATLKFNELKNGLLSASMASLIKILLAPLVGFLVARSWNLSPVELQITLIYLACPTAVASFVMAEQLKGDHQLTSNIIILSTLFSFAGLAIVLAIT